MLALIDGDIVAFRCAASAENDSPSIAYWRIDEVIHGIFEMLGTERYKVYLSGPSNFRKELYPLYKIHRADKIKPRFLEDCKEYLISKWNASVTEGIEADDALGIDQREDSIICSIDKDLKQIPGKHYNFVTQEFQEINPYRAAYNFYTQMLVGDTSDYVQGVDGIGVKKAQKLLCLCSDEEQMFDRVRSAYADDARMLLTGKLLWILREEEKTWSHPKLPETLLTGYTHPLLRDLDVLLESTPKTEEVLNQFMEQSM